MRISRSSVSSPSQRRFGPYPRRVGPFGVVSINSTVDVSTTFPRMGAGRMLPGEWDAAVRAHVVHNLTPERLSVLSGRGVDECQRAMLSLAYQLGIQHRIGGQWAI